MRLLTLLLATPLAVLASSLLDEAGLGSDLTSPNFATLSSGSNSFTFINSSDTSLTKRLLTPLEHFELVKRQSGCGSGPACSQTTCCRAGERCCPGGCCDTSEFCLGPRHCCPQGGRACSQTSCCQSTGVCCSSSPTGCCVAGSVCCPGVGCCQPGARCCGTTCCRSGFACERGTCVSQELVTSRRIIRFELNRTKNGAMLQNICKGMRGLSTSILTYSGQLSEEVKRTRRSRGGCKPGFCKSRASASSPQFASCAEFPPVMSDEGDPTQVTLNRQVNNCIPDVQNTRQGQIFARMFQDSQIEEGQTFALSMDCENILTAQIPSPRPGDENSEPTQVDQTTTEENQFPAESSLNETSGTIILPFGDLGPGLYKIEFKIDAGSIQAGGFVVDNLGDQLAGVPGSMSAGDSETVEFQVPADGELMGVGLVLPASNPGNTEITWSVSSEDLPPEAPRPSSSGGNGGNGGSGNGNGGSGSGIVGGGLGDSSAENLGRGDVMTWGMFVLTVLGADVVF